MSREQLLREKLRKIEALFAGAATEGEKIAAGAATKRIRERLDQVARLPGVPLLQSMAFV